MPIIGMEKQSEQFIFEQLPLDMQKLIVVPPQQKIREIITTLPNISDSVVQFKDFFNQVLTLRSVSKAMLEKFGYADLKQIVFTFLDALNQKFPGQEVRLTKLLKNNKFAQEWLTGKRKALNLSPYEPIKTEPNNVNQAIGFISNKDQEELKKWLELGYDPNRLLSYAVSYRNLPALQLLVAYGANINHQIRSDVSKIQSLLSYVLEQKKLTVSETAIKDYSEILDYLINEGAEK